MRVASKGMLHVIHSCQKNGGDNGNQKLFGCMCFCHHIITSSYHHFRISSSHNCKICIISSFQNCRVISSCHYVIISEFDHFMMSSSHHFNIFITHHVTISSCQIFYSSCQNFIASFHTLIMSSYHDFV